MGLITVRELLEAGVHFGHRTRRWNPKMNPYIHGKRKSIHIINLRETIKGLILSYRFLEKLAARGEKVLFVGTKRQAKATIKREAKRCNMFYVSERWIGGTLTNFATIRRGIKRLEEIEAMEKDGRMQGESKKRISSLMREKKKLLKNLEGFRAMEKQPAALVLVDPRRERNAVAEAHRVGIPVAALIDTDGDPELVDFPIPGNDDAVRVIQLIIGKLCDAILSGRSKVMAPPPVTPMQGIAEAPAQGPPPRATSERAPLAAREEPPPRRRPEQPTPKRPTATPPPGEPAEKKAEEKKPTAKQKLALT